MSKCLVVIVFFDNISLEIKKINMGGQPVKHNPNLGHYTNII